MTATIEGMVIELPPHVDGGAVLRAWLNPPPAHHAPAPAPTPLRLPDSWTVVASTAANVNPWVGDMPILTDEHYTCAMVERIRLDASTLFYVRG